VGFGEVGRRCLQEEFLQSFLVGDELLFSFETLDFFKAQIQSFMSELAEIVPHHLLFFISIKILWQNAKFISGM
jgi:hypothetical protein